MRSQRSAAVAATIFLAATLFPHTVALRLLMLMAAAVAIGLWIFAAWRAEKASMPRLLPPAVIPILLWAGWAALTAWWSVEPDRSWKEFRNEVVCAFFAYWTCFVAAQARSAFRIAGAIVAIAALGAALLGILQMVPAMAATTMMRYASGPGDQSSALLVVVPCVVCGLWWLQNGGRQSGGGQGLAGALWALLALFFVAAWATQNRTIWLGLAIQGLGFGSYLAWKRGLGFLRGRGGIVAAVATALVVSGAWFQQQSRVAQSAEAELERDPRLQTWALAARSIAEAPLTGAGFGRGIDRKEMRDATGQSLLWHSHNYFLELAVQGGIPALVLFCMVLVALVLRAGRRARGDGIAAAFALAALLIVAGMIVRNITDVLLVRQNALFFWGLMGMLFAWMHRPDANAAPSGAPVQPAGART